MALLPFLRAPSRSGTSSTERGVDTAPFQLPSDTPTSATTSASLPTTMPGGSSKTGDLYPGDAEMHRLLTELFNDIRSEGASIKFDNAVAIYTYDAVKKKGAWASHSEALSRKDLIWMLVERLCETPTVTSKAPIGATSKDAVTMKISGFEWVMGYAPNDTVIGDLVQRIDRAVMSPTGYSRSDRGWGFDRWAGTNYGHWLSPTDIYLDISIWKTPEKKVIDPASGRFLWLQTVYWEPPKDDWGWNLSDDDTPYVWGWDPKDDGDKGGRAGAHLGFPLTFQGCDFILWITKEEAFLEAVNRSGFVSGKKTQTLTVDGITRTGFPKFSAYVGTGYGQWVIVP